ncbi:MAG: hypothetical protein WBQ72_19765 [Terriglobales bacterium]|jgi:hypothetical protein
MSSKTSWNVYRTRFLVRARQLTEPLSFTDPFGRDHFGRPGDYLIETSDGIRRIATRAFFEDIYVPLAPVQFVQQNANSQERRVSVSVTAPASHPTGERRQAIA